MEQVFLHEKIRDRIQDLMKSHKVTQAELAARIGCSESMLSRFISGKTDKLGDENIIRIARVFTEMRRCGGFYIPFAPSVILLHFLCG